MVQSTLEHNGSPFITVIIPAYNVSQYIAETLDSVYSQTFQDFEVSVINDGSADTPALERTLERYDGRLLYLQQKNAGPSAARNNGIRHARGEFLAFLDGDDAWMKDYLQSQVEVLRSDSSLSLVWCDSRIPPGSARAGHTLMETSPASGEVNLDALIEERCTVFTSTTVVNREAVLRVGCFDESLRRCEDYDLWLRLASAGYKLRYSRSVLGLRRICTDGLSHNASAMLRTQILVCEKLGRTAALHPHTRELIRERNNVREHLLQIAVGKELLRQRELTTALKAFQRASAIKNTRKLKAITAVLKCLTLPQRALRHFGRVGHTKSRATSLHNMGQR